MTREGSAARKPTGKTVPSVIGTSPKMSPGLRTPTTRAMPSACLTGSIRPSSTAKSARSLPSSAAYSPGDEADVGRRARDPLALRLVEAREERDPGDLVCRDHGRILNRRGPTVRIKMARLPRHFLTGAELDRARARRAARPRARAQADAATRRARSRGGAVALVFEQPSTRTRTSFEVGIVELGGHPMVLRPGELQLTRGESVRDTALVLSRHVAAIALRTGSEATLRELAEHAEVPVVNMLSPEHHPCQALADLLTMREAFGDARGPQARPTSATATTSRARSPSSAGSPASRSRSPRRRATSSSDGAGARLLDDPVAAAAGADVLYTDVWVSMSDDEATAEARRAALGAYRIDDALLDRAAPGAFALHCLPAHPGEEISAEVLYGAAAADLGPGGEPPSRPEGAARAARRRSLSAWWTRGTSSSSRAPGCRRSWTGRSPRPHDAGRRGGARRRAARRAARRSPAASRAGSRSPPTTT